MSIFTTCCYIVGTGALADDLGQRKTSYLFHSVLSSSRFLSHGEVLSITLPVIFMEWEWQLKFVLTLQNNARVSQISNMQEIQCVWDASHSKWDKAYSGLVWIPKGHCHSRSLNFSFIFIILRIKSSNIKEWHFNGSTPSFSNSNQTHYVNVGVKVSVHMIKRWK